MDDMSFPSKEQVRAYMCLRERAHSPPPAPDEIRRQLGWGRAPAQFSSLGNLYLVLPGKIGQLSTLLTIEWLFRMATLPERASQRDYH